MANSVAGPSGGTGGTAFTDMADIPPRAPVQVVEVHGSVAIDSVRLGFRQRTASLLTQRHGGSGGQLQRLELRADEYILRIRGTYGLTTQWGHVVQSLTVDTNQRARALRAGTGGGGPAFVYEAGRGQEIAGFHGKAGTVVDALGVILRPRAGDGPATFLFGPAGGEGGRAFSDARVLESANDLLLSTVSVSGDRFLDSIAVRYTSRSGELIRGRRHGGTGGNAGQLVLGEGEYITAVSGLCGTLVDRIVIETNKRKEALAVGANFRILEPRSPFGGFYRYEAPKGSEIVGFFGRAATFVDALGVVCRERSRNHR